MKRYLLPAALLLAICFCGQNAWAHHPMHMHFYNPGFRAGMGYGFAPRGMAGFGFGVNPYAFTANAWSPTSIPVRYPGVGYTTTINPVLPPNIYTQSYFNSPAYGHWNGFGN